MAPTGVKRNTYRVTVKNSEEKKLHGKPISKCEDV
jgi:hypothetical protein